MALAVNDNPPELYLGSASTLKLAGAGFGSAGVVPNPDLVTPEIFGPCPWAVALVGSRKEKALAHWMRSKEYPYFLPLQKSNTSGTRNTTYTPVFDGVLFFQAHTENIPDGYVSSVTPREYEVRRHQSVYGVLKTGAQIRFKRELVMLAINKTFKLVSGPPSGTAIRVILGPWKGFTGYIQEPDKDNPRCIFFMEGIKQWASVILSAEILVKADMRYKNLDNGAIVEVEQFYPDMHPYHEAVSDKGGGHFRIQTTVGNEWIEPGDYIVMHRIGEITKHTPKQFAKGFIPAPEPTDA